MLSRGILRGWSGVVQLIVAAGLSGRPGTLRATGTTLASSVWSAGNACNDDDGKSDSLFCRITAPCTDDESDGAGLSIFPVAIGFFLMRTLSRIIPVLGCAAGCALAGCCLAPKSPSTCTNCVSAATPSQYTPVYENYTPPAPVIKPIPMPEVAPPPPAETLDAPPPPPQARQAPNSQVDFFESVSGQTQN